MLSRLPWTIAVNECSWTTTGHLVKVLLSHHSAHFLSRSHQAALQTDTWAISHNTDVLILIKSNLTRLFWYVHHARPLCIISHWIEALILRWVAFSIPASLVFDAWTSRGAYWRILIAWSVVFLCRSCELVFILPCGQQLFLIDVLDAGVVCMGEWFSAVVVWILIDCRLCTVCRLYTLLVATHAILTHVKRSKHLSNSMEDQYFLFCHPFLDELDHFWGELFSLQLVV